MSANEGCKRQKRVRIVCPECKSPYLTRSQTRGPGEWISTKVLRKKIYRCIDCDNRFKV